MQQTYKRDVSIYVYTGDDVQAQAMIKKVRVCAIINLFQFIKLQQDTFGIEFPYPDSILNMPFTN